MWGGGGLVEWGGIGKEWGEKASKGRRDEKGDQLGSVKILQTN